MGTESDSRDPSDGKGPLPDGWQHGKIKKGTLYFINHATKETPQLWILLELHAKDELDG